MIAPITLGSVLASIVIVLAVLLLFAVIPFTAQTVAGLIIVLALARLC